jgi:hypothetical protein
MDNSNNSPGTKGYGTGFILGVLAGLATYAVYATPVGQMLRTRVSTSSSQASLQGLVQHVRIVIARLRQSISPWLKEKEPELAVKTGVQKNSKLAPRRYFKSKK